MSNRRRPSQAENRMWDIIVSAGGVALVAFVIALFVSETVRQYFIGMIVLFLLGGFAIGGLLVPFFRGRVIHTDNSISDDERLSRLLTPEDRRNPVDNYMDKVRADEEAHHGGPHHDVPPDDVW